MATLALLLQQRDCIGFTSLLVCLGSLRPVHCAVGKRLPMKGNIFTSLPFHKNYMGASACRKF